MIMIKDGMLTQHTAAQMHGSTKALTGWLACREVGVGGKVVYGTHKTTRFAAVTRQTKLRDCLSPSAGDNSVCSGWQYSPQ